MCAKKEKVSDVQKVFSKWDLDAVVIGHVTGNGRLIVKAGGKSVVDIPVDPVVNLCPTYSRPGAVPSYLQPKSRIDPLPSIPGDFSGVFEQVLSSPTISDKEWIFRQYDHMVQTNTVLLPGADASLLRIKNSDRALAVALDGNSLYAYLDPKTGGKIAVAEACALEYERQVVPAAHRLFVPGLLDRDRRLLGESVHWWGGDRLTDFRQRDSLQRRLDFCFLGGGQRDSDCDTGQHSCTRPAIGPRYVYLRQAGQGEPWLVGANRGGPPRSVRCWHVPSVVPVI